MPDNTTTKAGIGSAWYLQALILLTVMAIAACGGSYGTLQKSSDAAKQFESLEINSDYNYYYSGSANKPRAIIGLDTSYSLVSKLWSPWT